MLKKVLKIVGIVLGVAILGLGGFVFAQVSAFNSSMDKVYDVPMPAVTASKDPAVIARGQHLAQSMTACATRDCHGTDLGGGKTIDIGPLGRMSGPNLSVVAKAYSDGEMVRLVRHGIKKDGRSLCFMPAHEINWLPESDLVAVLSYIRSMPVVDRPNGPNEVGLLGKVLDRMDAFVMDVARRIDHAAPPEVVPAPEPTAAYGKFIGRLCTGCHGKTFSGGPIPGAPPSLPVPLNITPHETGVKGWTYADFDKLLTQGIRKNGKKLDPFMPLEAIGKMDDIEKRALWAYLETLPPTPFGGR